MYDLIEGAEHYPEFLPWCAGATVLERDDEVVAARIAVDWHGVRLSFTTRNRKRRPEWLGLALAEGPFGHSRRLVPETMGDAGCRIDFAMHYEFAGDVLGRLASPVFERITDSMVDAFVRRADELGEAIRRSRRWCQSCTPG
jgi:ribosome-associated toxin RatA of RatAB toxin-antitoxin module